MYAIAVYFPQDKPIPHNYALGSFHRNIYIAAQGLASAVKYADGKNFDTIANILTKGDTQFLKDLYNCWPQTYITPAFACLLLDINHVYLREYLDKITAPKGGNTYVHDPF